MGDGEVHHAVQISWKHRNALSSSEVKGVSVINKEGKKCDKSCTASLTNLDPIIIQLDTDYTKRGV